MIKNPNSLENLSAHPRLPWYLSPTWQLVLMAAIIFIAELIAMGVIYFVNTPNYLVETFLDAMFMILLILPALYLLQMRPIRNQMKKRETADQALRKSEKLLRTVLELLPVGVWITDAKGTIQQGNQASQEIWGGARYVGIDQYGEYKGWWLDSGKRIEPHEWAAARAIKNGETSLNEEIEIENFDGAHKIILNSVKPFYDEHQTLAGAIIVNQDITERKQTEQALKEREALFSTAFQYLPVGVWLTDQTGKITYGNPAGQAIWAGARYVGMESYGEYKGWWLSTGKLIETDEWAVARAIDKGETSLNEEIEIECFDGSHKIILNSAIPVRDEKGRILWAFVVNQDITEHKHREQVLQQTNELLERFFTSIGTLIAYMDRDFNFIRVNESYAKSAGHTPDFFLGKNHFDLYPHPENEAIFQQVVETGEPFSVFAKPFEYAEYPDRGVTYWDWSLQPVKGANGAVQGVVLSLVDMTERIRAESQLAHQYQELRELTIAEQKQRVLAESLVQSIIALNSSLELEKVLESILDQIRRALPFQGADIILLDGNTVRVACSTGFEDYPASKQALEGTYRIEDVPLWNQIYLTHKPMVVPDSLAHAEWQIIPGMEWVRSYVGAPLVAGGWLIGIINLTSEVPGFFDEQIVERVMVLTSPASLALRNAQLYNAEQTARRANETLSSAAIALTRTLDLDQVLDTLLEHIAEIIPCDTAIVSLLAGTDNLSARAVHGHPVQITSDEILTLGGEIETNSLIQRLISNQMSILIPDTTDYPEWKFSAGARPIKAWLGVPIVAGEKTIGIVSLGQFESKYFSEEHKTWAEALVHQAAIAIQNAWLFEQVRASSERLQALARKLVDIQEKERFYIARELHDEAGQALSSLKLGLGRLEQTPGCPESLRQRLLELKGLADDVLDDLHRLAMDLRPVSLEHLGLVAALEQHASSINSDQLSVEFKALGFDGERLPPAVEIALYRIVQEALTNVVRHAQASTIGILLEHREGKVTIFVEDDGIGFIPRENDHSLGLVGMRERAELLGGTLTVESIPGKGTSITVEVTDDSANPDRG